MKQYIGISRDHSASMRSLASAAMADYNMNIETIKEGASGHDIDTIVSVIECGINDSNLASYQRVKNRFVVQNSSVSKLSRLTSYAADGGGTPLFDSIGELIEQLEKNPDAGKDDVSFLVMVITDGYENASRTWSSNKLREKITLLQGTDRWTFALRVPKGHKAALVALGIPEGNILEWETTTKGLEKAAAETKVATQTYYAARAKGVRGSTRFYSDLHNVSMKEVAKKLKEIKGYTFWKVKDKEAIKDFIEGKLGREMKVGAAFYQLMKPEKIQGHKQIAIRHKYSGKVYSGDAARKLLGIPTGGEVKVYPGNHGDFDVFVQSTSTNRKLLPETEVLYWEGA